jgi:adenylate kinase
LLLIYQYLSVLFCYIANIKKNTDIYHTTFDWPNDIDLQKRLIVPKENSEEKLLERLVVYNRHIDGIKDSLKANLKQINADQPKGDVFNQSKFFLLASIAAN